MIDCLTTSSAAGPCATCGELLVNGVHLVELKLYCAEHCPVHGSQATLEWDGEAVTVSGTQEALF